MLKAAAAAKEAAAKAPTLPAATEPKDTPEESTKKYRALQRAYDDGDHKALGAAIKAFDVEVPSSKADRLTAAAELLGM
jgi:hypothetical protein